MAKEIGTIRPGNGIQAKVGDRIRHAIVTEVTDQDNLKRHRQIGHYGYSQNRLDTTPPS